jgi:hypothetical protein
VSWKFAEHDMHFPSKARTVQEEDGWWQVAIPLGWYALSMAGIAVA